MSIGKSPKEVVSFIANEKVEVVDLRFMDFTASGSTFPSRRGS